MKENKIVRIKWIDSSTYSEWYNFEEIESLFKEDNSVESIGYLVFENKEWVIIAQNIDDGSCSAITKILKKSIIDMHHQTKR